MAGFTRLFWWDTRPEEKKAGKPGVYDSIWEGDARRMALGDAGLAFDDADAAVNAEVVYSFVVLLTNEENFVVQMTVRAGEQRCWCWGGTAPLRHAPTPSTALL